ncbi:MAG: hypothetical protein JO328_08450 [Hyphomicrobiales bacterium]|nr:hypothetical protein [Hyphomicrobiales bacterium]MBV9430055.1 hypothetical protein [Bradyrhizobiaceae bacterium]
MHRSLLVLVAWMIGWLPAIAQAPVDYPPSTNWWMGYGVCHAGHIDVPNIAVDVRKAPGQGTCGAIVITKNGRVFADAINIEQAGVPAAGDDVVAVAYNGVPCTGYCYDRILLYGIKANGRVIIGSPLKETGNGRRTADYAGSNKVLIRDPDSGDSGRLYCFDGNDWYQGVDSGSCDMTHHAQLTNLRAPGEAFLIVRNDYYGQ